ncbi:hypothetical protein T06_8617 [Trichinella sp. T6]|nr:hypothetical protein T06_8617 [Trichinella sp. T6]
MDLLQPNFQQILLYSLSGHGGSMYPEFTRCHRWFVSNCATICRGDSVCESKFFVNTERIMMKSHESTESGNRRTIFTIGWGGWKLRNECRECKKEIFMEITFVNYFFIIGKCISKKNPMPWELNFEVQFSASLFGRNIKDLVECHFQISGCVGQSEKFIDFSASLQKLVSMLLNKKVQIATHLSFFSYFSSIRNGKVRDYKKVLFY